MLRRLAARPFLLAALACFLIALLIVIGATGAVLGTGYLAWMLGGFVALVLDQLVGPVYVRRGPPPP